MTIKKIVLVSAIILMAVSAHADYQLDNANSSLYFTSIKKDKVVEAHTFKQLSGSFAEDGAVLVTVDLSSVETHIETRNERMKTMLFETNLFPKAKVSATVNVNKLKSMKAGDMKNISVQLIIDLHGKTKQLDTMLKVVGLSNGSLLVMTVKPMLINAFDFGLDTGIQKLMEAAKLPSIATAVPVSFSLVFNNQ